MDDLTRHAIGPKWRALDGDLAGYQVRAMTWAEHRAIGRGDSTAWSHAVRMSDGRSLLDSEAEMRQEVAEALLEAVLASPEPELDERRLWRCASLELQLAMHWKLPQQEAGHLERISMLVESFVRRSLKLPALALPWKRAALDRLADGGGS